MSSLLFFILASSAVAVAVSSADANQVPLMEAIHVPSGNTNQTGLYSDPNAYIIPWSEIATDSIDITEAQNSVFQDERKMNRFNTTYFEMNGIYCRDLMDLFLDPLLQQYPVTSDGYNDVIENNEFYQVCSINSTNSTYSNYYQNIIPLIPSKLDAPELFDSFVQQFTQNHEYRCLSAIKSDYYFWMSTFSPSFIAFNTTLSFDGPYLYFGCIPFPIESFDIAGSNPTKEPFVGRVYKPSGAVASGLTLKNFFRVYWTGSVGQLDFATPLACTPTINSTVYPNAPFYTSISPKPNSYVTMGCTNNQPINLTGMWNVSGTLKESPVKFLYNTTIFYKITNLVQTFYNQTIYEAPGNVTPSVSPIASPIVSPVPVIPVPEIFVPYCVVDPYFPTNHTLFEVIYYHDLQKAVTFCNTLNNITRIIYIRENTLIFLNKSLNLAFSYPNATLEINGRGSMILCDNCDAHIIQITSATQQSIFIKNITFVNTNGFFDFGNEQLATGSDLNRETLKTQESPSSTTSSLKHFSMENVQIYNEVPLVKINYFPKWRNMTVDVFDTAITQLDSSLELDIDTKYETGIKNMQLYEEMQLFLSALVNERTPDTSNPYYSEYRPHLKIPSVRQVISVIYHGTFSMESCSLYGSREFGILAYKNNNPNFIYSNGSVTIHNLVGQHHWGSMIHLDAVFQVDIRYVNCTWFCGGWLETIIANFIISPIPIIRIKLRETISMPEQLDTSLPRQIVIIRNNDLLTDEFTSTPGYFPLNNTFVPNTRLFTGNPFVYFTTATTGYQASLWLSGINNNPNILVQFQLLNNHFNGMPQALRLTSFIHDQSGSYPSVLNYGYEHLINAYLAPLTSNPSVLIFNDVSGQLVLRLLQYINSKVDDNDGLDISLNPPLMNGESRDSTKNLLGSNDISIPASSTNICNDYCIPASFVFECTVSKTYLVSETLIQYSNVSNAIIYCPYPNIRIIDVNITESMLGFRYSDRNTVTGGLPKSVLVYSSIVGGSKIIGRHVFYQTISNIYMDEMELTFSNIVFEPETPGLGDNYNRVLFQLAPDPLLYVGSPTSAPTLNMKWKKLEFKMSIFNLTTNINYVKGFECLACQLETLTIQTSTFHHTVNHLKENLTNPISLTPLAPLTLYYGEYIHILAHPANAISYLHLTGNSIPDRLNYYFFVRISAGNTGVNGFYVQNNQLKWFNPMQWIDPLPIGRLYGHPLSDVIINTNLPSEIAATVSMQLLHMIGIVSLPLNISTTYINQNTLDFYSVNFPPPSDDQVTTSNLYELKASNGVINSPIVGIHWYIPQSGYTLAQLNALFPNIKSNVIGVESGLSSNGITTETINTPSNRSLVDYPASLFFIRSGLPNIGTRISTDDLYDLYIPCNDAPILASSNVTVQNAVSIRLFNSRNTESGGNVFETVFGEAYDYYNYVITVQQKVLDLSCLSCNGLCPEPTASPLTMYAIIAFISTNLIFFCWLIPCDGLRICFEQNKLWRLRVKTLREKQIEIEDEEIEKEPPAPPEQSETDQQVVTPILLQEEQPKDTKTTPALDEKTPKENDVKIQSTSSSDTPAKPLNSVIKKPSIKEKVTTSVKKKLGELTSSLKTKKKK